MIRRARLRLTLWYSGALLLLLLLLSTVTYAAVTRTLRTELEEGISGTVSQWLEMPRRTAPAVRPGERIEPRGNASGRPAPLRPQPTAEAASPTPAAAAPEGTVTTTSTTPSATATATATGSAGGARSGATPGRLRVDPRLLFPPESSAGTVDSGSTSDVFLLAYRPDGVLAVNQRGVDAEPITRSAAVASALAGQARWETVEDDDVRLLIYAVPVQGPGGNDGVIVGARNLDEYDRQVRAVLTVLAMVAVGGGLFSLGGAYLFAGHALQPLQKAYDRQRSFVADASHELRSPLAVIRASSDLLLREPLPPGQRESVEEIRDVTQEAATLIDDLLELARAEDHAIGDAESDASAEVAAAVEQLRGILERRRHNVSTVLAPARVAADGSEVRRIVRALLENVAAHTPEGTPVSVEIAERGGRAVIAVEDAGPGIPEGQEATVFERFARLDEARTPGTGHGAGLGLAIVRSLAERRGGSVSASRPSSGGLRVEVLLPLVK